MADYISMKQVPGGTVAAVDDRILYDYAINSGIIYGCEISYLGNNMIHINAGYGIIKGGLFEMEDHTEYVPYAEVTSTTGQIYLRFDAAAEDKLIIVKETSATLHPMTQDEDANYDNGVYEIQLCTYVATTTALANVQQTFVKSTIPIDVLNSLEEIMANTDTDKAAGALAVKELNNNLTTVNKPEFKDITADFDDGTFSANLDKYNAGNYIKKGNYLIMLADYDYFYGGYNSYATVNTHHWVGLVFGCGTYSMNGSNTTSGGYNGSSMHSWLKSNIMPALQSTFGSSHFISHQKLLSTSTSDWAWQTNQYISLPSEVQIYGSGIWGNSGFDFGEANRHLKLFKNNSFMEIFAKGDSLLGVSTFTSSHAWLRCVSAYSPSTIFCDASYYGLADSDGASRACGAFPLVNLV